MQLYIRIGGTAEHLPFVVTGYGCVIDTVIGLVHVPKHDIGAKTQPSFRHGWHGTTNAWRLK